MFIKHQVNESSHSTTKCKQPTCRTALSTHHSQRRNSFDQVRMHRSVASQVCISENTHSILLLLHSPMLALVPATQRWAGVCEASQFLSDKLSVHSTDPRTPLHTGGQRKQHMGDHAAVGGALAPALPEELNRGEGGNTWHRKDWGGNTRGCKQHFTCPDANREKIAGSASSAGETPTKSTYAAGTEHTVGKSN
jgi:hypothetical protein